MSFRLDLLWRCCNYFRRVENIFMMIPCEMRILVCGRAFDAERRTVKFSLVLCRRCTQCRQPNPRSSIRFRRAGRPPPRLHHQCPVLQCQHGSCGRHDWQVRRLFLECCICCTYEASSHKPQRRGPSGAVIRELQIDETPTQNLPRRRISRL